MILYFVISLGLLGELNRKMIVCYILKVQKVSWTRQLFEGTTSTVESCGSGSVKEHYINRSAPRVPFFLGILYKRPVEGALRYINHTAPGVLSIRQLKMAEVGKELKRIKQKCVELS